MTDFAAARDRGDPAQSLGNPGRPDRAELDAWMARQTALSMAAMEQSISATHLCRRRDFAGQVIRPRRGSVLASPVIAGWDPEPDYFFHWLRDSAIVMRTVADLIEDARSNAERERWRGHFHDFVCFSLTLVERNESAGCPRGASATGCEFLRPPGEIDALSGDRLLAEPRFNPDGTVDVFRWSRPQLDGPALRALACLRYLACGGTHTDEVARLLHRDLDFTMRHAGEPSIGPWEEPNEIGSHYYVELVQLAALVHGRARATLDDRWGAAEQKLRDGLERYWSERHQIFTAMRPAAGDTADDLVDAATLLAVWDSALPDGPHSVRDPRVHKTQNRIEALFARAFPINGARPHAPALGRSRADRYFGGGAWYPTTLAAAGLCYRTALADARDRAALVARGDGFLATLRAFTPPDGALSEQIDRDSGAQTSARHLTWSYAAFISTARERAKAQARI